ncbi:nuclear transport factor 2 family protein [Aurantibacter sp.]|uniref:nuclear transport factor 2 family protein n=1 Tax=Aurantibacter sp. TaxID=2807103 RepID=UPI0035C7D61E
MKKTILINFIILLFFSCNSSKQITSKINDEKKISTILNNWHLAAANTNFDTYFGLMADNAIFIGTDATENWNKHEFMAFSKPYFDKGKAWSFTPLERHIFINKEQNLAWFDEILDTQMELCRGSGVLEKTGKDWKIKHYVLSITIPNENVSEVIELKKVKETKLKTIKFNNTN